MPKPPELFEYVGAVHIHTKDSDGSKSHNEIIRIADSYHLDFLLFTDHMTMAHRNCEGWHGRLLSIVGYEIQDKKNENHYLAFGLDEVLPAELSAPEYVRSVREAHGLGFIAHPDEVRKMPEARAYPWTAWGIDVFDGIEIWNHMSAWLEGLDKNSRLKSFLHPRSIIGTPSPKTLARWDEAAERRRVVGIGSLDAHAAPYRWGPFRLTLFPYKIQLQAIRTHVLTETPLPIEDFRKSKEIFLGALRQANAFISNYRWGNARGFRFWCESRRQFALMGESMSFHPSIVFRVELPEPGKIKLICKGRVVAETEGTSAEFPIAGDGAYRVEVLKGEKGWIYSNHIKIFPSRQREPERPQRFEGGREVEHPKGPQKEHSGHEPRRLAPNDSNRHPKAANKPQQTAPPPKPQNKGEQGQQKHPSDSRRWRRPRSQKTEKSGQ